MWDEIEGKKSNIVYESICTNCNPGAKSKGPLKDYDGSEPSLHVGETARSLHERAKEHLLDFGARGKRAPISGGINWSIMGGAKTMPFC